MASSELSVMLTAKGNLEGELRTARDRVKDLGKQIRDIQASGGTVGDDLAAEFMQATRAVKTLGDEVNRTNRKIKDAATQSTTAMGKLGGAIVKHQDAIRNAGLVAGGALALLAKSSVTAASNLQESMSKIGAVFGEQSTAIVAWSETSAAAFGQSQQQALEAAGTYGNLFQAFGIGRSQAAEMSTTLVTLASDLASFNNTSVDEALLALRSGLSGETEPLKRYGATLSDVRLKEEALAMGIYDGTGTLGVAAKAQAAYSLILKDTAMQQGDFIRTADGLANSQKTASAEFENAKSKLGTDLLPVVTAITKAFATFAGFVGGLPAPVRNVGLAIGAITAAAMIATPRIISMIASMKLAGVTAGGMASKMRGAAGMAAGAFAGGLAVAAAALMTYKAAQDETNAGIDKYLAGLDAAGKALTAAGMKDLFSALTEGIDTEDLQQLPLSMGEITEAVAKGGSAYDKARSALEDYAAAADSAWGPDGERRRVTAETMLRYMDTESFKLEEARGKWEMYTSAAKGASWATEDTTDALIDVGAEAEDATKKIAPLTRALNRLTGAVARQQAFAAFKKSIKDSVSKPSKDAAYEVVDNFDAAFKTFKEGGARQAQFVIDNYDSVETAVQKSGLSKKLRAQLLKPLQDAKTEAEKVLTAVNNIDGASVTAKITYTGGTPTQAYAPVRRAQGGAVWGSGTATSDSIPAMLSNGEYVLRAAAVRTLGLGTLNKLNHADKMTDPALLDRMAVGGTPTERATGPLIGSIVVHNPAHDVDVERAVVRGMARAERIKKERG